MKILVTGSIATGKSQLAQYLHKQLTQQQYQYLNIDDIIINNQLFEEFDSKYNSYVPDEQLLLNFMKQNYSNSTNLIVDHYNCDIFGNTYFDLIVHVSCNTEILYQRYILRQYSEEKIKENMETELLMVIYEEIERFQCEKIYVQQNYVSDTEQNAEIIIRMINKMQ
ncbi:Adenylate_kinase [Hexamita inflata]|uniref:Adenylate kinase n=1 Tax=Hexamita inflata TaxID=28002 RepID=A0AA86UX11_9EUKA|nr:Adenylate kinase [Hexamita inflata]